MTYHTLPGSCKFYGNSFAELKAFLQPFFSIVIVNLKEAVVNIYKLTTTTTTSIRRCNKMTTIEKNLFIERNKDAINNHFAIQCKQRTFQT